MVIQSLERYRSRVALLCGCIGLAVVVTMHFLLPDRLAEILIDRNSEIYPLSVQNGMWIVFCVGVGEVLIRIRAGNSELSLLQQRYLPEDYSALLQSEDLVPIYRRVREESGDDNRFLPRLIERAILQFHANHSVEQTRALLQTSAEMHLHEVDLRYGMLRYITWLIPFLGFIGTVLGIGNALRWAGDNPGATDLLVQVTSRLGVSFNGTLVALVLAACLVFLANVSQSREEQALNRATQYCLDNLVNRLYIP